MWRPWLALTLIACGPSVGSDGTTTASGEVCGNGVDDDGDALADCADSDCAGACPEQCLNGVDDDGDGAVDCDDDACDGACPEACEDTRDNDGDGLVDCADLDCVGTFCVEDCGDGRDNDGDAAADCTDTDCNDPACAELCTDGRDDDGDGLADCEDPDCDGSCPESCADGRDNDGNGFVDCDDAACEPECDEDCANDVDDDADGTVDCVDPECAASCDADLDGFLNGDHGGDDCDDTNPFIHPEAQEVCDGADNDCDGTWDEDDASLDITTLTAFHVDADGDGYGAKNSPVTWACMAGPGLAAGDSDCDDTDPIVNPSGSEVCDGLDNDCDGLRDDADPTVDLSTATTWYPDQDQDTFGAALGGVFACNPPAGYVANDDDCNDMDDHLLAPGDWIPDADGDGYGSGAGIGVIDCVMPYPGLASIYLDEDCDETNPAIHPDAPEICEDYVDQNCDGLDLACFSGELGPDFSADGWHQCAGWYDTPAGGEIPARWAPECEQADENVVRVACGADLAHYRYIDVEKNPFRDGLTAYPEHGIIYDANYGGWINDIYATGNDPNVSVSWWAGGDGCNEFAFNITVNNVCTWEASNCFGQGLGGNRFLWVYAKEAK